MYSYFICNFYCYLYCNVEYILNYKRNVECLSIYCYVPSYYCIYFNLITCLQDYIFSLLTGYCDAPAGVEVREGLAYNAYFAGGTIGMPQQLFNDGIEYEDGM